MPQVELLVDVAEGGRDLEKALAAAASLGLGESNPGYPRLKVTDTKRGHIEYRKGLVVTMNDDGAAKWVERGIGKIVETPTETELQTISTADVGVLKV